MESARHAKHWLNFNDNELLLNQEKKAHENLRSLILYRRLPYDLLFRLYQPFYALFMPAQSNSFCHKQIAITDEAIATKELQNIFLNMIYNLDKEKLYRMYDDKFGEEVEMLGSEE